MPTSTTIPKKYLRGRQQPGAWYKFTFEAGLPELIVDELKEAELPGGTLPVLQIACERLYWQTKPKTSVDKYWKIRKKHYDALGSMEIQVDQYLTEKLAENIDKELPKLSLADREEERALWMDLLYKLVIVAPDNRALSSI